MSLLKFYQDVIESVGGVVDENGLVSLVIGEEVSPVNFENKRLSLPTEALLADPDWENIVPFHPLSENIARGESEVINNLRLMMNTRITYVTTELMFQLMTLAADVENHKKLGPAFLNLFKEIPNVNEKTVKVLSKIINAITLEGEHRLSTIYLKRGGEHLGQKYKRLAVVFFPITDKMNAPGKEIFGVNLTNAEKESIVNLFYYLLPNSDNVDMYSCGSDSDTAPYFHALCGAYAKVMLQLNKMVKAFKKNLDGGSELLTNLDWIDTLDQLDVLSGKIPPLPYNEGRSNDNGKKSVASAAPRNHLASQFAQTTSSTSITQPDSSGSEFQQPDKVAQSDSNGDKLEWNQLFPQQQQQNQYGNMQSLGINPLFQQPNQGPVVDAGGYHGLNRGRPVNGNGFGNNSFFSNSGNYRL